MGVFPASEKQAEAKNSDLNMGLFCYKMGIFSRGPSGILVRSKDQLSTPGASEKREVGASLLSMLSDRGRRQGRPGKLNTVGAAEIAAVPLRDKMGNSGNGSPPVLRRWGNGSSPS